MAKRLIQVPEYTCERCHHVWIGRNLDEDPKTCASAKCRSPYWNTPRKRLKKKAK